MKVPEVLTDKLACCGARLPSLFESQFCRFAGRTMWRRPSLSIRCFVGVARMSSCVQWLTTCFYMAGYYCCGYDYCCARSYYYTTWCTFWLCVCPWPPCCVRSCGRALPLRCACVFYNGAILYSVASLIVSSAVLQSLFLKIMLQSDCFFYSVLRCAICAFCRVLDDLGFAHPSRQLLLLLPSATSLLGERISKTLGQKRTQRSHCRLHRRKRHG